MKEINWQGVYPAVTPQYFDDMSINFEATKNMVDSLMKEGVHGIIALGTVGEERVIVEKLYNDALATRIDLSKLNLY